MTELEELKQSLAIAIELKFDKREIDHLKWLIELKEMEKKENERRSIVDTINYPYGSV